MKKSLFYSVAIAAAMASCTQEVIEVPSNNVQDLSLRPTLGEVVLAGDLEVESRFATGEGALAVFEEGDKLGAAIMDKPLYTGMSDYNTVDAKQNYEIVNYYSSNSAFTNKGGAWYLNEDQPLVEGNYLFYAPYNQAMQLRTPLEVCVPAKQDASTAKAALDEYYASGSVVSVGYQFLAADGGKAQKPKVSMQDVMAYPVFTITNNFKGYLIGLDNKVTAFEGGSIKVDSIQLLSNSNEVVVGGKLNHANVANVLSNKWAKSPFENYTTDLLADGAKTVVAGKPITTLIANREIEAGKSAEFYAVMPAVKFEANELQANVYVTINEKPYVISLGNITRTTNSSTKVVTTTAAGVVAGHTYETEEVGALTLIKGQRYPQEELNFADGKLSAKTTIGTSLTLNIEGGILTKDETKNLQVAQEIEVNVDGPEQPGVVTDLIDNNEEFINYFKNLNNGSKLVENTVDKIEGVKYAFSEEHTVTINAELIEALSKYNNKGTLSITTALQVEDDVTVVGIEGGVTFKTANGYQYTIALDDENYTVDENALVVEGKSMHIYGTLTLEDVIVENVYVYEGATVTVPTTVQFEAASFINEGTLNVTGLIINPVINNGVINVVKTEYLRVGAGVGTIYLMAENVKQLNGAAVNVKVTGGEQTGIYVVEEVTKNAVLAAEDYDWISELKATNEVDFASDILAAIDDITTFHIVGATYPEGTFNMNGLTLCMDGTGEMTIKGINKSLTKVYNVVIKNASTNQVKLQAIAAEGEYVKVGNAGDIYTVNATWNGEATGEAATEKAGTTLLVNNLTGLLEVANMVNNGTLVGVTTIKLMNDIDLNGIEWAPIGTAEKPFNLTFDGNNKTIKNLKVNGTNYVGLFGKVYRGTIKNVIVDGADVDGNHYVGVIAGHAYGSIEKCTVKNSTVDCVNPLGGADGDKAGAIVGYLGEDAFVTNCKAENSQISAGRDAGQLVGATRIDNEDSVTGEVSNVSVKANGTADGSNVRNALIGRLVAM